MERVNESKYGENRTMKPIEIVLSRGERGGREGWKGHTQHFTKKPPCTTNFANKNVCKSLNCISKFGPLNLGMAYSFKRWVKSAGAPSPVAAARIHTAL
jgi:hypothetical protein